MLKFSIVTAVRNRVDTIGQALASVREQTWPHVEHIVVDGDSDDGTLAVLEPQRAQLACLISEPDSGIYDALNKGLARATGDIVGFLHSDDYYADPRVLERIAAAFENPAVDGVYGDLDYVSRHDTARIVRRWRSGPYRRARLAWGWMPPHPTLYLRRAVYQRWGGFDSALRIAADYDAILRYLGPAQIGLAYLPEVLIKMRTGGASNRSLAQLWRKSREDYLALRRNRIGGLVALLCKNLSKLPQFLRGRPRPGAAG